MSNNIRIKPFITALIFILLMGINLSISLNNYNFKTISLNKFLVMQGQHQYSRAGKLTTTQVYRESIVEEEEIKIVSCDTCRTNDQPIKKIISRKQGIRYIGTLTDE